MSFMYRQTSPALFHNGILLKGSPVYSGHGVGLNNHTYEGMQNIGPIPAGAWRIELWLDHHADKGPVVARLVPIGHNAHGRSGFLIHGDNPLGNFSASHGCIIAPRMIREAMRKFGDTDLLVTSGLNEVGLV